MNKINTKIILITGGSSGIGKKLAHDLLRRGETVVIISHDQSRLATAERELRAVSPRVRAIPCDIRNTEDVQRAVAQILEEFGRLDVLVNNAGYAVYRAFEESSIDEVLDIVDVNLLGVIRCTKAVIPSMKARGIGQIVNISSIGGTMIITPNSSYCASKHGVVALSEALRYELDWKGVSRFICDTFIMHPSFVGIAQKVNRAKRIDKKHVFERMPFLHAAILQLSVDFVARTIHGTFYAVMDKKGGASVACNGSSCDGSPCNRCTSSSAVRARRRFCGESAPLSAPCTRDAHLLTFDWLI